MGGWLAVLSLALVSFAIAAFVVRLPKQGFVIFTACLLFGLAGYAWQGSPSQGASPKVPDVSANAQGGEAMVDARTQLFADTLVRPDYLIFADGYARRGRFAEAATALRGGLKEHPDHLEGWLALAMALTGHADGFVTPASAYAFDKANKINPDHPGADYFLGVALVQSGQIRAGRDVWARLVERLPEGSPIREGIAARVEELDAMIANAPMLQ